MSSTSSPFAQASSTLSDISSPEAGPNTRLIVAIVVSVLSATFSIIALSVAVRCYIVRRRRYIQQEKPNPGMLPETATSQMEGTVSVADTGHSSIWGDWGEAAHSIVPASSFSEDVWDSRLWPLPPGHSERYTFFSERSSTSVDDTLEIERWSVRSRDENEVMKVKDCDPSKAERESSGSIWGMPESRVAR
ncbi:hypothetical protein GGR54DRAFT_624145 [Hypoxylon sp. NC1633]|nr:hypothetical protein GGR54DRAFT_624145 [Hypoxylon sp. NC1633]